MKLHKISAKNTSTSALHGSVIKRALPSLKHENHNLHLDYLTDDHLAEMDNIANSTAENNLQRVANPGEYEQTIQSKNENKTGLPDSLKAGIENLSGLSMDDVKVHRNSDKPAQFQAHAYAQGTDIHIGPSQEKHIPHEAWHVVQQKQGRVKPTLQMKGGVNVNDDIGLEKEADVMGGKAVLLHLQNSNTNSIPIQKITQSSAAYSYANVVQRDHSSALGKHREAGDGITTGPGDAASITNELLDIVESAGTVMNSEEDASTRVSAGADIVSKSSGIAARILPEDSSYKENTEKIGHAAELIRASIETYNAFVGFSEAWSKDWSDVFKQVGEFMEKIADVITAGADILKDWFDQFKELKVTWAEALQKACLVIQKAIGCLKAWNRMKVLQIANAQLNQLPRPQNRNPRRNRNDELSAQDHLIGLNWDMMKQNALEAIISGVSLAAKATEVTGIGAGQGAIMGTGAKVAEAAGRVYVKSLRAAREWNLWYTDQSRTDANRTQIAQIMLRLQRPVLFEAAGIEPGDRRDLSKIKKALEEHN